MINEALRQMKADEYCLTRMKNDYGNRTINIEEEALNLLKAYYEGKTILVVDDKGNIEGASEDEKARIYSLLQKEYVKEDVFSLMEDNSIKLTEEEKETIADMVGERYAVDKEYDCNLSYWENINNLLYPQIEKITKERLS